MAFKTWLLSGAAVLAAVACSSDEHALGGGAGSSGSGGSAAAASGNAGSGGSQSGTGGATTGGGAGTAGSAGKGGSGAGGGTGGGSGSGGSSGATGGSAGEATSGGSAGEGGLGGTGEGGAGGAASTCEREGGTVVEIACPPGREDFANFCNVGLCSTAPETLTDSILECQCPSGCWDGQHCISEQARLCMESGGKVTTNLCCGSVDAFPDTCSVGACSCSPDNSHDVPFCACPEGGCFDGRRCK